MSYAILVGIIFALWSFASDRAHEEPKPASVPPRDRSLDYFDRQLDESFRKAGLDRYGVSLIKRPAPVKAQRQRSVAAPRLARGSRGKEPSVSAPYSQSSRA